MTNIQSSRPVPLRLPSLAVFLVVAVGISSLIGVFAVPGEWYAGLSKPPFNPPNWVFAPVWLALYFCIGFAGWLVWRREPRSLAMGLWAAQMGLNWVWSPVFFRLQAPWPAAAIIVSILALIIGFIVTANRIDRRAAWLFVPYAAWVGFASALNIATAILN